jgi:uncharacterized protein (DUF927 family)/5S rRNA maturation endonuclease (ribonuclease M5)
MAQCPAHDDAKNSLKISEQADGKITLTCFAGCDVNGIVAAMGFAVKELYPPKEAIPKIESQKNPEKKEKSRRVECEYLFADEHNSILFKKVRYRVEFTDGTTDKTFNIFHYQNGWKVGIGEKTRRVLYNLADVVASDRIFICEGEKDADNLAQFGFTTTTNFEGAVTWRDEYNEFFENKIVVLVVDNDIAGIQRAEKLKDNLKKATSIKVWNPFSHEEVLQKKGKDVSDWIDLQIDAEKIPSEIQAQVESILEGLPFEDLKEKSNANETFRKDYRLSDKGLYHITHEKDNDLNTLKERETWVCSPIQLKCWTRDKESGNWGRFTSFKDPDGVEHKIVLPVQTLQGEGSESINVLSEQGLIISRRHKSKLLDYLLMADNGERATCVTNSGWHGDDFVLPDKTFSKKGNQLILQNIDLLSNKFRTSGTLEEWQVNISNLAVDNSRLIFAISLAFASVLMPLANEPSGGFHLRGDSSTGKSTALYVAGSVLGGENQKGFLETWRATSNGFEVVAQSHNHSLLLLDEISQVNPREIGDIIYTLANGFGKNRMTKTISARKKMQWQLLYFSSGESSLADLLAQTNERSFGGQEARFVDLEADANKNLGLFENLHHFANGADFSKHLVSSSCKFFGTAIREFLQVIIDNKASVETYIREVQKEFSNKVFKINPNAAGEILRVALRFALVAAAGELATKAKITKWHEADALQTAGRLFDEWLSNRGTTGNFDVQQGINRVFSFLKQNASMFQKEHSEIAPPVRHGFIKKDSSMGETIYYIFPESFKDIICKGFSALKIAKELERLGHLQRTEVNRYTKKELIKVYSSKQEYFYVIQMQSEYETVENVEKKP